MKKKTIWSTDQVRVFLWFSHVHLNMTRHADGVIMRAGNRLVTDVWWENGRFCAAAARWWRVNDFKWNECKRRTLNWISAFRQRLFHVDYLTLECADDEQKINWDARKRIPSSAENIYLRSSMLTLSSVVGTTCARILPRLVANYARSSRSISLFNWLIKIWK